MDAATTARPARAKRAGGVTRLAAFFVDAIVLTFGLRTAIWLLRASAAALGRLAPIAHPGAVLVAVVPLLAAVYHLTFWTALGQTPGKWLMGVEIVLVEGGRLTFRRAVVRLAGYVVSALPCYLGFLWILAPGRRGWHDRLARTEVTYVRRAPHPKVLATTELRARIRGAASPRAYLAPPARPSKAGSRP